MVRFFFVDMVQKKDVSSFENKFEPYLLNDLSGANVVRLRLIDTHTCIYVCMYVCMYACIYVCVHIDLS